MSLSQPPSFPRNSTTRRMRTMDIAGRRVVQEAAASVRRIQDLVS
jgi:hypothetical protein